jgi:hypothetical protein
MRNTNSKRSDSSAVLPSAIGSLTHEPGCRARPSGYGRGSAAGDLNSTAREEKNITLKLFHDTCERFVQGFSESAKVQGKSNEMQEGMQHVRNRQKRGSKEDYTLVAGSLYCTIHRGGN